MTVTLARYAGFCPGVRRATQAVENAIAAGGSKIYTLGRLIHNEGYCRTLAEAGVTEITARELDGVFAEAERGENVTVVIRAHGEEQPVIGRLTAFAAAHPNFRIIDGTCPFVEKVRKIARENSGEGKLFFLLGAKEHPEVRGILSCAQNGIVFSTAEELKTVLEQMGPIPPEISVTLASQTTQKVEEWEKSVNFLKKVLNKATVYGTICSVTDERQREAAELAVKSDAMIVIGSRSSSNTVKLYEVCRERCPKTYFTENGDNLPTFGQDTKSVSITAGASTPSGVIQEVYRHMAEIENFAEMLEDSIKTLNSGDVVTGIITSISATEVHLDLGAKATGVIAHEKLTNDSSAKLTDLFKVGDEIRAKVIKVSDIDGIATLDKLRVDADANWEHVVAACDSGEILEGRVVEAVKGGVIIDIDGVRCFIPGSLSGIPRDGDLSVLVGTTQKVKIAEIKTADRKRATASIVAVLREERKAKKEEFWNNLAEGQEFDGVVRSLTDYGAFIDLGCGVDGLVHVTELSWKRIRRPSDVIAVGDPLHVYVKSFDREKGRISLGYKTDEMNPWFQFTNKYAVGDVATVKVVSLMSYGAFAEIVPGVDGLIHISQLADHRVEKVEDIVTVGQEVDVRIINIDDAAQKVSLSIRQLAEQPAVEEVVAEAPVDENAPKVYSTDNPDAFKDFTGDEGKEQQ